MSEKTKRASEMFGRGQNCAQAVLGAFCPDYGLALETALKIACGLGSGLRSAQVCGAVSGAVLVVGLKYGEATGVCNAKTEEFVQRFQSENGSIVCRDILGCDISTPAGKEKALAEELFTTKCRDMVIRAVELLEELGY